jgi:hypothetical protein
MISTSLLCSSFKQETLLAIHNFMNDQFMLALYTSAATIGPSTISYVPDGEVVASGYLAGGKLLTGPQVLLDPGARIAFATFSDPIWPNSQITARGALLYNSTKQNRAVAVIDFGSDQVSNLGDFHVLFPPAGVSTALIRFS